MNNPKKINDFILNLFTTDNDYRPRFKFPNKQDGIVYATDGHALIAIDENELSKKYESDENFANCKKVFDEKMSEKLIDSRKFCVESIIDLLLDCRLTVDRFMIRCPECDGDGFVLYTYENKKGVEHEKDCECPECEGVGKIRGKNLFPKILIDTKDNNNDISIKLNENTLIVPIYVYKIFLAAQLKGVDGIRFDIYETFVSVHIWHDIQLIVLKKNLK
jgi:hypothetical protein